MIFIPRSCINLITQQHDRGELINPSICIKMMYKGYEISIGCDSSICPGDLTRTDIRVYQGESVVTQKVCGSLGERIISGTVENLMLVISCIDNQKEV